MVVFNRGDRLWYLASECQGRIAVVVEARSGAGVYIKRADRKPLNTVISGKLTRAAVKAVDHGEFWRLTVRP